MGQARRRPLKATFDIALGWAWLTWLVSWAPTLWWPFEVAGNFPVQLMVGGALLTPVFAYRREVVRLLLAVALVAVAGVQVVPVWTAPEPSFVADNDLVLSLHNVLRTNATPDRVADELMVWQPDLMVLEEVSEAWTPTLARLDEGWPTSVMHPADHNFGIAARSKQPWDKVELLYLCGPPAETLPALDIRLTHEGRPLRVLAVHFLPPVSGIAARLRREQVDGLVRQVRATPELPTVIVGDLNTSMFAQTWRTLLRGTGLRDARSGRGLLPSWPAGMPGWARLPLDHVLVPEALVVTDVELGGLTGSDHRGLRVALRWR